MQRRFMSCLVLVSCVLAVASAAAQTICPSRPTAGSQVVNPLDLYSQNGVLNVSLALKSQQLADGTEYNCYVYMNNGMPIEAPTLRLNPGDLLNLSLTNNLNAANCCDPGATGLKSRHLGGMANMNMSGPPPPIGIINGNPCLPAPLLPTSTNIHFHGLNVPPICHQDEVISTNIPNNGVAFQYSVRIPTNEPPGLYWYHPHLHGFTANQVGKGAAGAIIVEGSNSLTTGLPERVLIIRQQLPPPGSVIIDPDAGSYVTLNFQPSSPPHHPLPFINVTGGQREYWRILNASTEQFLNLQVRGQGTPLPLEVIAIDGVPLTTPTNYTTITVPPAGRVEFIMPGIPPNTVGNYLYTAGYNTGPTGDVGQSEPQILALVQPSSNSRSQVLAKTVPTPPPPPAVQRFAGLASVTPDTVRSLYFSEQATGTNNTPEFFITVAGQQRAPFNPQAPPAIITNTGAVEDWTVQNQSSEVHAFHIHQIHFLVMAINGIPVTNPTMQDTIDIPNWPGTGPYPSVTLRMDFRDPNIVGTFVFHCHILDHEDAGMMQKILVQTTSSNSASKKTPSEPASQPTKAEEAPTVPGAVSGEAADSSGTGASDYDYLLGVDDTAAVLNGRGSSYRFFF